MSRHLVIWFMFMLALCGLLLSFPPINLLEPTPETTIAEQPVRSLFADDTCAPPCWFGLTPGVSTSRDVIAMFEANVDLLYAEGGLSNNVYEPNTEYLIEGGYSFYWRSGSGIDNFIAIEEGIVSYMLIEGNTLRSLDDVLETLGSANTVKVARSLYVTYVVLFYSDLRVVITLSADLENCSMSNLLSDYILSDRVLYYKPNSLEELDPYQRFLDVPAAIWGEWLTGGASGSCEDAIATLAAASITPTPTATLLGTIAPSLTPTVTPMPSATP